MYRLSRNLKKRTVYFYLKHTNITDVWDSECVRQEGLLITKAWLNKQFLNYRGWLTQAACSLIKTRLEVYKGDFLIALVVIVEKSQRFCLYILWHLPKVYVNLVGHNIFKRHSVFICEKKMCFIFHVKCVWKYRKRTLKKRKLIGLLRSVTCGLLCCSRIVNEGNDSVHVWLKLHHSITQFCSLWFLCFVLLFRIFFCFVFSHHFVWSSSILEQPESSSAAAEAGVLVIPEISVTHVSGERTGNGEKGRTLGDIGTQHVQGVQETATEPRSESRGLPELRRQKSVRKMMEDGMSTAGRVQF